MDVCPEGETEWMRVDPDLAAEQLAIVKPKSGNARTRLGSLGSLVASGSYSSTTAASFTSAVSNFENTRQEIRMETDAPGTTGQSGMPVTAETPSLAPTAELWTGPSM